jgi:hypothetical protein
VVLTFLIVVYVDGVGALCNGMWTELMTGHFIEVMTCLN